jgi:hypothetical protein
MAVAGLMMAHQVAGKAARDGIFLSQFGSSALPLMMAAAAVLAILTSFVRSRTLVRLGPQRIAATSFAASGALQLIEWTLLGQYPRFVACVIYLHIAAFGAILLSGFWSLVNESFDPRAAKQAFGRISGMGTLGGLAGGILAERLAAWMKPSAVVFALGVLHLLCAVLLVRGFRRPKTVEPQNAEDATIAGALRRYPFLYGVAGLLLAVSIGSALLDFVFKTQAAQELGKGAPLIRFFGLYYTATSLLVFLAQSFAVRPALEHAGLAASAGTLPAALGAGSLLAIAVPGFPALATVRGLEILVRGSIFRSAYELFYSAVAPAEKRAIKSIIDVGVDRLGDALGAGLIVLLLAAAPGRSAVLLTAVALSAALAMILAIRLRTGYIRALEKSLVERAVALDPALVRDSTTRSLLLRTTILPSSDALPALPPERPAQTDEVVQMTADLRSGDPARAIAAAAKVGRDDWVLAPLLINQLAWDGASEAAREALQRIGPKITGMMTDVLLDPQRDFAIRRRLPRVLAFVPSARSVEGLIAALSDERFEVRFYAARALSLLLRDHAELAPAADRIWAVVNREVKMAGAARPNRRLLDTRDSHWYFDEELRDRADRNLEHLFTLLSLLLPMEAVRISFRALHTTDQQLRGAALEYLESATPPQTRRPLLNLLEGTAVTHATVPARDALDRLLLSKAEISKSLRLPAVAEKR